MAEVPFWEHFPHGADIGVRGIGRNREEAFEQAALALAAVVSDPSGVAADTGIPVSASGPDDELLFVAWLDSLIYEMATRSMVFGRFRLAIDGGELTGMAWGEALDVARHQPAVEIKAATYAELSVRRRPDGSWLAQCVVDV